MFGRPCVWFIVGASLALIAAELGMHPIAGKADDPHAGIEQRWYTEGLARSHFSTDGLRSTANASLPGAPALLILGDSHVAAFQVADSETMGSVLEHRLREDAQRYNVLQYGWSGAGAADYVFEAALVEEHYRPAQIFLLVTAGDFGAASSATARLVENGQRVEAVPATPNSRPGQPPSYGGRGARLLKQSGLLYAAALRFTLDIRPLLTTPATAATDAEPMERDEAHGARDSTRQRVRVATQALRDAYGSKLFILYAPAQPWFATDEPEPEEVALLAACSEWGVSCTSLRSPMLHALNARHELARGFANSQPGFGHLNSVGHELAAEAMRARIRDLH